MTPVAFHNSCMCVSISFSPEHGNAAPNELSCFYFTSGYAHILSTLSTSYLLVSKEDWEEREQWDALCFPFYVIVFSVSGWLTQESSMNKKGCGKFPWLSVFLRISLPFFLWPKELLVRTKSIASLGCAPVAIAGFPCTHVESLWMSRLCGLPRAYAQGALWTPCVNCGHPSRVYLFCPSAWAPLDFTSNTRVQG